MNMGLLNGYEEIENNLINDKDYQRNLEILKWIFKHPYPIEVISQFHIGKVLHGGALKDLMVDENKIYIFYINIWRADCAYVVASRIGNDIEQLTLSRKEYITFIKSKKEYESVR